MAGILSSDMTVRQLQLGENS